MNVVSASWADHLVFGEEDGRLDTPEQVCRRMRVWRDELGAGVVHWRVWIGSGLVGHLIVNQNSSQCPSMWHQLWPMHRGGGYVQNYLDGYGLPPLFDHLRTAYAPAIEVSRTQLFVARQWSQRCADEERELCAILGVAGLVFSSFRHDNPAAIARGDWRAGASRQQSSMSG